MIVLDASAVVDVVLDQPAKVWVLDQLDGVEVVAPSHQLAEVVSALARLVRASEISPTTAAEAADEAAALRQRFVVPTSEHLRRALEHQDRLRVLDALYVVLADEHRAPLVTTDERLARAGVGREVVSPGSDRS